MPKPIAGSIVHFFPGTHEINKLPNGMTHAAAIITQVFGDSETPCCNMMLLLAEPDANKKNIMQKWSVPHKTSIGNEEMPHWDWPEGITFTA